MVSYDTRNCRDPGSNPGTSSMPIKVLYSNRKINPFGGICFVIQALKKKGIGKLIDNYLGTRIEQAKYSYSDIILSWCYANLCGAERLEDTSFLNQYFKHIPRLNFPSPDSIGRVFKSLATKSDKIKNANVLHEFNSHEKLNELLLDTAIHLGLLDKSKKYTLDYDNTIIETEKYDSKYTYKQIPGYQPGVSLIGKLPVYVQGRNGNSMATYKIDETIKKSLDLLKEKGVSIDRFRSDAAGYTAKLADMMDNNGTDFFIRIKSNPYFMDAILIKRLWTEGHINGRKMETCSFDYFITSGKHKFSKDYRAVVSRIKDYGGIYHYRGILTNNKSMSDQEVVDFYNMRGSSENNFDVLKNDFNWKRLPFSFLNENTVFMLIGALISVIYQYLVRNFSRKVDFVKRNGRLKNFIFKFITVCVSWIDEHTMIMYTKNRYSELLE